MKTQFNLAAFALLFTCILHPSTSNAQGSLTPPGAPAPTMKTLAQMEPRVPISTAPFTIAQPGSYYLTTNLMAGKNNVITITTNNVMLDLNGFTIASSPGVTGYFGIYISSDLRNITIKNGFIRGGVTNDGHGNFSGPGFGSGISCSATQNVLVSGISVSGCRDFGISVGVYSGGLVQDCQVHSVGVIGIVAETIRGCVAMDCGGSAFWGQQVSDSHGQSVHSEAIRATTAHNCAGMSSENDGLRVDTAQNCYGASASSGYGLYASKFALNCSGVSASGTGLFAFNAQNCYGESQSGPRGLYAQNAAFCVGFRTGGRAIEATIANGCWAAAGTNLITYKYNMP